ncbi:cobaltochelatase subunit CobN, partial [Moorena sp. SIO3B2]
MHRIAATPGGWNPEAEGVIFIEQTPAPIIFLTAADTDIQTLAASVSQLPPDFPAIRVANLLQLQQQLTIDTYAEDILGKARIIIIRLLGGRSYWSYGLEVVKETVEQTGATLFVLPGDDRPDPTLTSHSTETIPIVNQLWRYFTEGGVENFTNALKFVADVCLDQTNNPPPPKPVPRVGVYPWKSEITAEATGNVTGNFAPLAPQRAIPRWGEMKLKSPRIGGFRGLAAKGSEVNSSENGCKANLKVGILFYRAHYLAGNTAPIDGLCQALVERGLEPVPVFVSSLRDLEVQRELLGYFQNPDSSSSAIELCSRYAIAVLLNTTSFSVAKLDAEVHQLELWEGLDVPVLQVILSSGTVEQWESGFQGLMPRDTAMNVALPEVDGRIISRAISFKSAQRWNPALETDVVVYEPVCDRIQ